MLPAHERQRLLFYNTMIRSVLHYVSTMWTSCDKQNLGRVLKLRKTAARVMSDADNQVSSAKFQVSSLLRKIEKIQNRMYHCSQLAIAIRGKQWLDTKQNNYNNNTIKILSRINYYRTIH